jgi:hypothetical protein
MTKMVHNANHWIWDQVMAQFPIQFATQLETVTSQAKIPSVNPRLTQFLGGGIPKGAITEMGIPVGFAGRSVVADFVSHVTQTDLCLWVNGHSDMRLYPPAWISRGVNPLKWVVANSDSPVRQLKASLMQPIFQLLVLDMESHQLSAEDIAFISMQARIHRYAVVVIRPFLLSNRQGNSWAKLRLNVTPNHNQLHLSVIKGLSERQLTIPHHVPSAVSR